MDDDFEDSVHGDDVDNDGSSDNSGNEGTQALRQEEDDEEEPPYDQYDSEHDENKVSVLCPLLSVIF